MTPGSPGLSSRQDMDLRRKNKELEFVWKPDAAAPSGADGIFTVNFASGAGPWGMAPRRGRPLPGPAF